MERLEIERDNNKLIVIRQSFAESVLADLSTIAILFSFTMIGALFHSIVTELLGAFIGVFFVLIRMFDNKTRFVTPDQAIDIILTEFPKKKQIDIKA